MIPFVKNTRSFFTMAKNMGSPANEAVKKLEVYVYPEMKDSPSVAH